MMTAEQVAQTLATSKDKVYNLYKSGDLPGYRFGRLIRFSEQQVQEYITSCQSIKIKKKPTVQAWFKELSERTKSGSLAQSFARLGIYNDPETGARLPREKKEKQQRVSNRRPENIAYHASKRRAIKKQRTAKWADQSKIEAIYLEAIRLTNATGIKHHVDHIIPLQGKLVSGLHVHQNLQVLTAKENMSKHNYYEIKDDQCQLC